jgi:hypothetical protein
MNQELIAQEYGFIENNNQPSELVQIEQARAIQEAQAPFVIAQKFPRNVNQAFANIMTSCDRIHLAEMAFYNYPKGGKTVSGISIRLAEVIAQNWGHIRTGVIELSRADGVSIAKAYAWDVQTGFYDEKIFSVSHIVDTKQGGKKITGEREIYELVANMGARRKRACILAVIPGDIQEAAEMRCKKTLKNSKEPLVDRIRKVVDGFKEFGIQISHIEKRLGHNIDATTVDEVIDLGGIFKAIRDGMGKREDFFDLGNASATNQNVNELIAAKKSAAIESKPSEEKESIIRLSD